LTALRCRRDRLFEVAAAGRKPTFSLSPSPTVPDSCLVSGQFGIARSTNPQFNADCFVTGRFVTFWSDTDPVAIGDCHYYLVRAGSPNLGSWGMDSTGTERTAVCP
jgi:hypothetical protein